MVLKPEVVVCLGATAAKALISPSFRITRTAGRLLPWTPAGRPTPDTQEADDDEPDEGAPAQTWMLATTHPSAILQGTPDESWSPTQGLPTPWSLTSPSGLGSVVPVEWDEVYGARAGGSGPLLPQQLDASSGRPRERGRTIPDGNLASVVFPLSHVPTPS